MKQNISDFKNIKIAVISIYSVNNLGARYLHAYLKGQGYFVKLFFFKNINYNDYKPETEEDINNLIKKIKEEDFDLVGISLVSSAFADLAKKITQKIKEETSALVVWGGVHATVLPEKCIDVADIICVGEGEKPISELAERLKSRDSYTDIANLWVKKEGVIYKNAIRNLSDNIDDLPWPKYEDSDKYYINNNKIRNMDPKKLQDWEYIIMTARGCPYQCSYCINSFYKKMYLKKGKYIRQRSVKNVIDELVFAKTTFKNLKKIAFFDDVFGLDTNWNKEFAAEYKKKIGLPFWCYAHPQSVKKVNLEILKDAGLYMVDIGLQSGSEKMRKEILKRVGTNEKFREAMQIIHEVGVAPYIDILTENPYETVSDKKDTFDLLLSVRPYSLLVFSLTHFPMTELTNKALSDGIIKREDLDDVKKNIFLSFRPKTYSSYKNNENNFWNSLIILSAKEFIPVWILKYISRQNWIKQNPRILVPFVFISNYIKWCNLGLKLIYKKQVNLAMVRQWARYAFTTGS